MIIFESKYFYIELVEDKDLNDVIQVYNSNKYFLVNHMDDDNVLSFWLNNGFKKFENVNLNWTGKLLPAVIMKKEL